MSLDDSGRPPRRRPHVAPDPFVFDHEVDRRAPIDFIEPPEASNPIHEARLRAIEMINAFASYIEAALSTNRENLELRSGGSATASDWPAAMASQCLNALEG
jgi:hypothetical protein